jgi:hypothetical protein
MSETHIFIRLLSMHFPRNWEFGSALSKLRNFGGRGFEIPNTPSERYWCPLFIATWNMAVYYIESPHSPRHSMTTAVLSSAIK